MAIPTQSSLHGVIVEAPRLTPRGLDPARFFARVEVHQPQGDDPRSADAGEPTQHDLVMFGPAAERAYSLFRAGDAFVASGYVDSYEYDGAGMVEEFVAEQIGHDSARTRYGVDRHPARRSQLPMPSREPAPEPPSPGLGL